MEKKILSSLTMLCLWGGLAIAQQSMLSVAQKYAELITPEELEKHLRVIAADSMEGRHTGSLGQKKAAKYIAQHFERIGLKKVEIPNIGKSYFQPFEIVERKWNLTETYLIIGNQKKELFKDFFVKDAPPKDRFALGNSAIPTEINGSAIFAGFGIETAQYSDFTDLNVKDKFLVVFDGEPKNTKGESLAGANAQTKDTEKYLLALQKGAKGLMLIAGTDQPTFQEIADDNRPILERGRIGLKAKNPDEMPIIYLSISTAAQLLKTTPKDLLAKRNEPTHPKKKTPNLPEPTYPFRIKAPREDKVRISSENVIGYLEGTDKKNEVVILTAHYDHVGISKTGEIHNGADDDGSGTVSVMKIAEAFAKAYQEGIKPRRSIVFMTVAGEEIGLFGSRFYTDIQPLFPLEKTVVNLNIDMIGRVDEKYEKLNNPNYIYLIGSDKLSTELHHLSEEVNQKTEKLILDYTYNDENDPNRFYYRSDHYNFAKNNVPIIFYFNGTHADYHKPTDDVEKINFAKMNKIARLIFYTAWEIASRENAPKVDKKGN
ncbi:MAG: M28 family peptidase [Microscillaceae bacterium]|nr:M28 family peptidase [Microscillaceae bacterium]MDW8459874.1 M28 family peptidase [Cytophagales bacterium]